MTGQGDGECDSQIHPACSGEAALEVGLCQQILQYEPEGAEEEAWGKRRLLDILDATGWDHRAIWLHMCAILPEKGGGTPKAIQR